MNQARYAHTATLLNNGLVLVTGGFITHGAFGDTPTITAELFNPQTGTWRYTGIGQQTTMSGARAAHTATKLADGRVLITGGFGSPVTADIFDPANENFTPTASMLVGRSGHAAVLLSDGRVLVMGSPAPSQLPEAEIFDPRTKTWAASQVFFHGFNLALVKLQNGTVLATGGTYNSAVDLFDPLTDTWQKMMPMLSVRALHSASLLPDGTILLAGGNDGGNANYTAEIYDVKANGGSGGSTWVDGSLTVGGFFSSAVSLASGDVFLAGGQVAPPPAPHDSSSTGNSQLYSFQSKSFLSKPAMLVPRAVFPMTLLANGQILTCGGVNYDASGTIPTFLSACELRGSGATTGTINITTNLAAATFTITGPTTYNGSGILFSQPNAPAGTYTVTYDTVVGYNTPSSQTHLLSAGTTIAFAGTYLTLPSLILSPPTLAFSYPQGAGGSMHQTVTVSSTGSAVPFIAIASTTPPGGTWLSAVPNAGSTPQNVSVNVTSGLPAGTYKGQITINSSHTANNPQVLPVTLVVTPNAPPTNGTGTIVINSNLTSATFTISPPLSGPRQGPYPVVFDNVAPGQYNVHFNTARHYFHPADQTLTLNANQTLAFIGTYKRVFAILFTGFGDAPPSGGDRYPDPTLFQQPGTGMTTLAHELSVDPILQEGLTSAVFTYYTPGNGGGSCTPLFPACTPPKDDSDDLDAQKWLTDQNIAPEDRLLVIGHSYGGNRGRLFSSQLAGLGYTVDGLGLVDPIDWRLCAINNPSYDCDLTNTVEVKPDNVSNVISFTQASSSVGDVTPLHGYHLYSNKLDYPFTEQPFPFTPMTYGPPICIGDLIPNNTTFPYYCAHRHIDDDPFVHTSFVNLARRLLASPRQSIYDVRASNITTSTAAIFWSTQQMTLGEVFLAVDSTLTRYYNAGSSGSVGGDHTLTLTGLDAGKTYYFKVFAQVIGSGVQFNTDVQLFTTLPSGAPMLQLSLLTVGPAQQMRVRFSNVGTSAAVDGRITQVLIGAALPTDTLPIRLPLIGPGSYADIDIHFAASSQSQTLVTVVVAGDYAGKSFRLTQRVRLP